jgi:4-amino-4-deoxy-L-arabinose transferase-like glycosyltransferase
MSKRAAIPVVIALMAVMLSLNVLSIRDKTLTYDEPLHMRYGLQVADGNSSRFMDGTMPFSVLNAVPQKLAAHMKPGTLQRAMAYAEGGRYTTMLFSLIVALFVFKWASELYGTCAGLFALFLYALAPNIIAHSRLITTDVFAMGMIFISTYYMWRFLKSGGWRLAALSAFVLGLSQLAKYVAIFLYPIFIVIVIVRYLAEAGRRERSGDARRLGRDLATFLKYGLLFVLISLAVINAGFLFNGSFTPLKDYEFRSEQFRALQQNLGVLNRIPIPMPYPFLDGLDRGRYREETGKGYGNMYMLGELRSIGGFKGYYLVAFVFKIPLAIQAFIVIAAVYYLRRRKRFNLIGDELFLLCPVVLLALYFNLIFKIQIGIRHALVVFPFLHVLCASPLKYWKEFSRRRKALVLVLAGYLVVSVLSYFPHYIPYFNEIVWDRKQAYRFLADSNIDWGQADKYFERYMEQHPDVLAKDRGRGLRFMKKFRQEHREEYGPVELPDSGLVIVNVNDYVGVRTPERYRWLRENRKPIDHVAYAYLLFDLQ